MEEQESIQPPPPRASGSWQSAIQLNPIPPPLSRPSRLGKIILGENDAKVKVNLMHEDQRRRRLSVLDTSEFLISTSLCCLLANRWSCQD